MLSSTSVPLLSSWNLAAAKKVFSEGRSLRLQFPAEDLGFQYPIRRLGENSEDGAAGRGVHHASRVFVGSIMMDNMRACTRIFDSSLPYSKIPCQMPTYAMCRSPDTAGTKSVHRVATYLPITRPGARLPHCEIELLPPQQPFAPGHPQSSLYHSILGRQHECGSIPRVGKTFERNPATLSTHDVVAACGMRPLLVVGDGVAANDWVESALAANRHGYQLQVLQVLPSPDICVPVSLFGWWQASSQLGDLPTLISADCG